MASEIATEKKEKTIYCRTEQSNRQHAKNFPSTFLEKKTPCDFFQICEQKGLKIMDPFASLYLEGICKDKRLNADLKLKSSCIHN